MRYTRTFTRYFGEDELEALRAIAEELRDDAEGRSPYMSGDVRAEIARRLLILDAAIELLGERVLVD